MSLLLLFNSSEAEIIVIVYATGTLKQNVLSGLFTQKVLSGGLNKKEIEGELINNVSGTMLPLDLTGTLNFKTQ